MSAKTQTAAAEPGTLETQPPGRKMRDANRQPRILFMVDELASISAGGTERQLLQLVSIACKNGLLPQICVLRGTQWLTAEIAGSPVMHFDLDRVRSLRGIACMRSMVHWMREQHFDILETFFPESNLIGPWLGKAAGIPIIVGTRRNLNHDDNWKKFGFRLSFAQQWLTNFWVREIHTNAFAVQECIAKTEWAPRSKMRVIYNGIDLDAAKPSPGMRTRMRRELGLEPTNLLVGNVSGLRPVKGLDVFVEAAALCHATNPSLRFVVVGDGSARGEIESLVRARGLEAVFQLAGAVDEVQPYLAAMDIAVLSSHAEGLSNSILEYMAVGLPTIATDVGGNREALNGAGILVPAGNALELSKAIHRLEDQVERDTIGKASRRAVEQFDVKIAQATLGRIYWQLLERSIEE